MSLNVPNPMNAMIPRTIFSAEHEDFRRTARRFFEEELAPHREKWEEQQHIDRNLWNKAGELGLLCPTMPEEYGGSGVDRLYSVIMMEEQARAGDSASGFSLHSDIVANYLNNFASEELKQKWLPKMASGEAVGSIAMTEPGTGSDLQAVRTSAIADGDDYIVNGSKIFITNGYLCDISVVVVKTGDPSKGAESISLLLIEADRPGFSKGRPLKKVGMKGQDTCELFFDNVRVLKSNLIGMENAGFLMIMNNFESERLGLACYANTLSQLAFDEALSYAKNRVTFGKPLSKHQVIRHKLADMATRLEASREFTYRVGAKMQAGIPALKEVSMAKNFATDVADYVTHEAVQIFGGAGYNITGLPPAWTDAAVLRGELQKAWTRAK